MNISKKTSAYLAGLLDGEGYFGILCMKRGNKKDWSLLRNKQYIPVLKMASTDEEIVKWLKSSFGGTFETRKSQGNRKESYMWSLRKKSVLDFVREIYPHLRIKKKQADILLRFPSGRAGMPLEDSVQEQRKDLYNQIKVLNKRGAA